MAKFHIYIGPNVSRAKNIIDAAISMGARKSSQHDDCHFDLSTKRKISEVRRDLYALANPEDRDGVKLFVKSASAFYVEPLA